MINLRSNNECDCMSQCRQLASCDHMLAVGSLFVEGGELLDTGSHLVR
jgi:hypothetical protein